MVEYTAVIIGVLGLMAALLYLGFKLSEKYDPLKVFFITMFFIWGVLVLQLCNAIAAANSAPAALVNAIAYAYRTWIVITSIALLYIAIWVIPDSWRAVKASMKKKKEEKGNLYEDKE